MSTKSTLRHSKDFHLYTDWGDEPGGPHAYLRIDNGLVKRACVVESARGLSVTLRLPPEVFPILRPDIVRELRRRGRSIDWKRFVRGQDRLRKPLDAKKRNARTPSKPEPPKKGREQVTGTVSTGGNEGPSGGDGAVRYRRGPGAFRSGNESPARYTSAVRAAGRKSPSTEERAHRTAKSVRDREPVGAYQQFPRGRVLAAEGLQSGTGGSSLPALDLDSHGSTRIGENEIHLLIPLPPVRNRYPGSLRRVDEVGPHRRFG